MAGPANQNAAHPHDGSSVVLVYARFDAGSDLEDDVLERCAPFHYVASRPANLDASRIAVSGVSWGGLKTLGLGTSGPSGPSTAA